MSSLKTKLAISLANLSKSTLKSMGKNATSFPGKLANKIDKDVLSKISDGYEVIIVTGTNGKTQTTSFIKNILSLKYPFVISNEEGANLYQGIVSLFLDKYQESLNYDKKIAVLEVDEASVKYVTEHIEPKSIVLTNVFIDQIERFSNISVTFEKILEGIIKTKNSKLVINGDCPVFAARNLETNCIYYGFNPGNDNEYVSDKAGTDDITCPKCAAKLNYNFVSYSNIGDYSCPSCEFKRPNIDHFVTDIENISFDSSKFKIDGNEFTLNKGGIYNIYNALAAYSCVKLFDVDNEMIQEGFNNSGQIFGRQETIDVDGKDVTVYLIKNPTGANQIIQLMQYYKEPFTLLAYLNNQYADGINYQWIYKADFEKLKKCDIDRIFIGGSQQIELGKRFEKAGFSIDDISPMSEVKQVLDIISKSKTKRINILASYTCLTEIESIFKSKGYLK